MPLLPCEYSSSFYLPRLRLNLAVKLAEIGYKQEKIAEMLSISQPVIHSYLKKHKKGLKEVEWIEDIAERLFLELKSGQTDHGLLIKRICHECRLSRSSGPICTLHRNDCRFLPGDCTLCHAVTSETEEITSFLRDFDFKIRSLIALPGFHKLVPEVGSQVALQYKEEGAASFPGRLIRVKDSVKILAFPEFRHTGTLTKILRIVRQKEPSIKGILAIKYTERSLKVFESDKQVIYTQNGDSGWEQALSNTVVVDPAAIADSGGLGYEPIIYLLGKDLDSLLATVTLLLEMESTS
ncbi:MAG: thiamine-phosphate synthase family protein [Candidatus Odinarchaeota archaeon]